VPLPHVGLAAEAGDLGAATVDGGMGLAQRGGARLGLDPGGVQRGLRGASGLAAASASTVVLCRVSSAAATWASRRVISARAAS
jgi:hypothetical protein